MSSDSSANNDENKAQVTGTSQDDKNLIQNVSDKDENSLTQVVIEESPKLQFTGSDRGGNGQGDGDTENKNIITEPEDKDNKDVQKSDESNTKESFEIQKEQDIPVDTVVKEQDIPVDTAVKNKEDEKILEEERKGFAQQTEVGTNDDDKTKTDKSRDDEDDNKGSSRISLAMSSVRMFIAWVTVGKIGPGFLVAPVVFSLIIHVMMFVLGIRYSHNCTTKPLVPVSMVLLGGDGLLKSLSYLLQIVIVIQTKMTRVRAMIFISESSVLDNGLNSLYVVAVILGAAGVFVGEMATCQVIIFHFMFYYTIIALCVLGLIFILILWKLVKPNEEDDFIDARGNVA